MQDVFWLIREVASSDANVRDPGRERHRQGAGGVGHPLQLPADGPGPTFASAARRCPSPWWSPSCSGTRRGPSPGRASVGSGASRPPSGGTLFLDEIGDLPLAIQAKLLRVLQERQIERLGSNRSIDVDVRFVSASLRSLEEEIAEGSFREDLFFRINTVSIHLPPAARAARGHPAAGPGLPPGVQRGAQQGDRGPRRRRPRDPRRPHLAGQRERAAQRRRARGGVLPGLAHHPRASPAGPARRPGSGPDAAGPARRSRSQRAVERAEIEAIRAALSRPPRGAATRRRRSSGSAARPSGRRSRPTAWTRRHLRRRDRCRHNASLAPTSRPRAPTPSTPARPGEDQRRYVNPSSLRRPPRAS